MLLDTIKLHISIYKASRAAGGYEKLSKSLIDTRAECANIEVHCQTKSDLISSGIKAVKAEDMIISVSEISSIDISGVEAGEVLIYHKNGNIHVSRGFDAIETVMVMKPSALEGRRLKWDSGAWALHNIMAHPLVQVLAWLGFKKQAVQFHDWTTPTPRGFKK